VLALLVVIGAAVGVVAAVWSPGLVYGYGVLSNMPCHESGSSPSCGGLVAAPPGLIDRIELGATTIAAGHTFEVTVALTNETSGLMVLQDGNSGCAPAFVVALTNRTIAASVMFAAQCVKPLVLKPGSTLFRFAVLTTYDSCAMVGGLPCQPPPLPPGSYFAVLIGDGQAPLPPAVAGPVTLVGAGVGAEAGIAVGLGSPADGTVDGQIIQVGGPAGTPDMAVRGIVTLTNVASGISYHASANRTGGYAIKLPPGTYSVKGISLSDYSDGEPMGAVGAQSVAVVSGEAVEVNLYVQIR
jgi:hypothetical protein